MSRHATLSLLVRQAALQPFARQFAAEYSEEIATIPTLAPLAATVNDLAAKAKAIGPAERSAGAVLYKAIREEFDKLLSKPVDKSLATNPVAPAFVSQGSIDPAAILRAKRQRDTAPSTPVISTAGVKVRKAEDSSFVAPKGRKAKAKLGAAAPTARPVESLPTVRVRPVESLYHAWEAFFHDIRHVAGTQASAWHTEKTDIIRKGSPLTIENLGKHAIRKDGVEVVQYENGAERVVKAQGLSPATVLERHMDLIGSTPAGMLVLRRWRGGDLSPAAALDQARLIVHMDRKGRDRWVMGRIDAPDLSNHAAKEPHHGPTHDLSERRAAAAVEAQAAIIRGRNVTPLAAREDMPHWDVKVQGGWIVGPRNAQARYRNEQ